MLDWSVIGFSFSFAGGVESFGGSVHSFINFPLPKEEVLADIGEGLREGGAPMDQVLDAPPGVSFCVQECPVIWCWVATCDVWSMQFKDDHREGGVLGGGFHFSF